MSNSGGREELRAAPGPPPTRAKNPRQDALETAARGDSLDENLATLVRQKACAHARRHFAALESGIFDERRDPLAQSLPFRRSRIENAHELKASASFPIAHHAPSSPGRDLIKATGPPHAAESIVDRNWAESCPERLF